MVFVYGPADRDNLPFIELKGDGLEDKVSRCKGWGKFEHAVQNETRRIVLMDYTLLDTHGVNCRTRIGRGNLSLTTIKLFKKFSSQTSRSARTFTKSADCGKFQTKN